MTTDPASPGYSHTQTGPLCLNLWGRACVVVKLKNGGTLRIGTDDAENLVRFLETKTGGRET